MFLKRIFAAVRKSLFNRSTRDEHVTACPASSILSSQRQLDFPILFERYQQQSGLWEKWESRGVSRDFQGRWEARETCSWFSSLSTARLFPQPIGRAFLLLERYG